MVANTSWIFNKFWNTSAKEILKRVKEYSTSDLIMLADATISATGGPQAIQRRFIARELYRRFKQITIMAKKKKNPDIDGYPERHLAAMIRRKMIQKNHGDETKYDRKNKSWKKELKDKDND